MEKTLEELRAEADALGVTYAKTIGADKLAAKIEEFYNASANEVQVKVKEEVVDVKPTADGDWKPLIAKMRADARKTKVVTITSNDKRDNEFTTECYLSVENQYLSLSKRVPLDIPVELEACLIAVAEEAPLVMHRDEVIGGHRTGNKSTYTGKAYNVSYTGIIPSA